MKPRRYCALYLFVFLAMCATTAWAQTERGGISGRVTDSAGGVLQGATVTLAPSGGSAITDQQGEFVIAGLTVGDYTITVTYVGFSAYTQQVHVNSGRPTRVDAALQVGTQSEQILVTAER